MFEFVRNHTRLMMGVMFLLIIPSFVLFGLEGYTNMRQQDEAVARVDGRDVTRGEWEQAHKQEVDRLRQQMPTLDAKLLDSPEARYATLERIVRDRVLAAAAEKSRLVTSDQRLARELQTDPTIAGLRRPDGSLDMERYRQLVGAQGMTPEMFENQVRSDLSRRQVLQGLNATAFAPAATAGVSLGAFFERREVQVARFNATDFTAKVNVSEADIEAYYKENAALFQAPEQANIEYIVLDVDTIAKGLSVSESELKTYYEQNLARLAGQEERRASHILINAPKSASAEERKKARARADELLAAARKAPDSFADLARKNSQDPGSAAQGGDLDFFSRGAMVKPFEDAAYALKKGEISDVVESEFGYHIIRLTDIKAPKQPTFDEMRPQLEAELRKQMAQRRFAELAETFTNGVYEQSDSLKPTAEKLKLDIRTANAVKRNPAPGTAGVLGNAKFLAALFSADATEKKRNTEAVEITPTQLAAGRVMQYTPARTLPLAEVKDQARQRLVTQRAAEMARKEGESRLAAWKATPASATLPAAVTVSREELHGLPPTVVEAALRADGAALPAFVGVDLGAQGYAVVKVSKLVGRVSADAARATQEQGQYNQWWSAAEGLAYYDMLKERFKAQIKVDKPAAAASAAR